MVTLIQTLQHALASRNPGLPNETQRIILKEILQSYVLDFIYNHPAYRRLNFYGGTCLHLVYGLNRLSEDLDLDNSLGINLSQLEESLQGFFQKTVGYQQVTCKVQQGREGILRLTLKFPLLSMLGLSPYPQEALHVKLEISHHQQVAVIKHTPLMSYGRSLVVSHFSLETMMAGKVIACLERQFRTGKSSALIKGRDFYDLLWLMQQRVVPLEEKLSRDGKQPYTTRSAMLELQDKVALIKPSDLAQDLLPMFESGIYVKSWLQAFQQNFSDYVQYYLK